MRDSLGKDIEPYVLDQNMLSWGIKKKTNIMKDKEIQIQQLYHIKTIKGSTQPWSPQIDQFKNFCNALLNNERSYLSYFCKSCIWAKGQNRENFVFRLKCPRINSGKPAFCVVCPINNHQSVGHWAKYWCRNRCFIIFQCYMIFIIAIYFRKN